MRRTDFGNNLKKLQMMHLWCNFTSKLNLMARQSISLTEPNDEWLKNQVDKKEYSSKSELVNDLIRQARKQQVQIDWIKAKIEKAENSGFTSDSKEQILKQSKSLLNG
jgi:antitoxin ParD1/3/4